MIELLNTVGLSRPKEPGMGSDEHVSAIAFCTNICVGTLNVEKHLVGQSSE